MRGKGRTSEREGTRQGTTEGRNERQPKPRKEKRKQRRPPITARSNPNEEKGRRKPTLVSAAANQAAANQQDCPHGQVVTIHRAILCKPLMIGPLQGVIFWCGSSSSLGQEQEEHTCLMSHRHNCNMYGTTEHVLMLNTILVLV